MTLNKARAGFLTLDCSCGVMADSCIRCMGIGFVYRRSCRRCGGMGREGGAACLDCQGAGWRALDNEDAR